MTNILLVDSHPIVLEGLRQVIGREPGLRVAGETGSGLEVERLVATLRPDLVLVDLVIPGINGLEITRLIRARHPGTRVIILSTHASGAYVAKALHNGAGGYVLKSCPPAELLKAVREVVAGRHYLSAPLSEKTVEEYLAQAGDTRLNLYRKLSARERQVLGLAAHGIKSSDIGARLHISPRTVEVHRANIMRKLGLRTQAELYCYALSRKIVVGPMPPADPGHTCNDKTCEECQQETVDACHKLLASAQGTKRVCELGLGLDLPFN